ncbi:uncharacterized protein DUF3813 [Melghiribacillus thermohalophilus]|uniref:Uncharacterized protein DUF3813 n=1 Tax=Melghiribacillus thermohalophilus TaxID=1324956 RepID=A0A4R3N2E4_9BACI|nr:DUF3813 domain-containing protein [Melghiribacillus thermohalophilus]TCT22437.1 uncharacterized protein DUF3813 [Melghiribacillus thermohalophilus]
MANRMIEQAREAVNRLTNMGQASNEERERQIAVARNVIQSAYQQSTPEEQEQLEQLERQIENHLK